MTTNRGHKAGEERNPSVGYDQSDLGARGILIFFLVLAVFAVAVHVAVLGMWVGMSRIADKHDPELSPLVPKAVTPKAGILQNTANVNIQKFPEPRLENDSTANMTKFLLEETAALTAEPWQDPQGNVHLPIDQAIKVVSIRLPVRAGTTSIPNYPGVAREYADPSASADATAKQDEGGHREVENSPATK